VDLIVTDPAYSGMNRHLKLGKGRIVGRYQDRGQGGKWFKEFEDTEENYRSFLGQCRRVLKDDRHFFIMLDAFSLLTLGRLVREYFRVKNLVVWDKVHMGMGHYFRRRCEFIVFACKGRRPLVRRDLPDVWAFPRLHNAVYPTQKPVALFARMIASSKRPGDKAFTVCDPFVGSGSSAVAALKSGARFMGADISPKALEISRRRIATYLKDGVDPYEKEPEN
jgi:site-specific DNA-methyltransferase (adenine-specific)